MEIFRHPRLPGMYVGRDPDTGTWACWLAVRDGWQARRALPAELGPSWQTDLEPLSPGMTQYVVSATGAPANPA